MKEFNIEEWLNKKPDTTNQENTDQEKSVQIREIRGDKNMIRVNSCQFVDQQKYVQIPAIRGGSSVDLQEEIELLTKEIENRAIDIAPPTTTHGATSVSPSPTHSVKTDETTFTA